MPDIIRKSDCNLKLFVNCRNTRNIADSLYRTLPEFLEGKKKKLVLESYKDIRGRRASA